MILYNQKLPHDTCGRIVLVAGKHTAPRAHLVVGIPIVDVPVPVNVVPIDVDEQGAAYVSGAICVTAV